MTDETTDPTDAPAEEPTEEKDYKAEADKWKALARKHESEKKANADKAKRYDELEAANQTELEKAQKRAEEAERVANEATSKALRAEVAQSKGVPAQLLSGSTQEELEAAADALLEFKGATPSAPSSNGQGNVGTAVSAKQQSADDWLRSL